MSATKDAVIDTANGAAREARNVNQFYEQNRAEIDSSGGIFEWKGTSYRLHMGEIQMVSPGKSYTAVETVTESHTFNSKEWDPSKMTKQELIRHLDNTNCVLDVRKKYLAEAEGKLYDAYQAIARLKEEVGKIPALETKVKELEQWPALANQAMGITQRMSGTLDKVATMGEALVPRTVTPSRS